MFESDVRLGISPVVELPRTEKAYREWIRAHVADGFVITGWKEPEQWPKSLRYLYFHRADCPRVSAITPKKRYVTGDRLKACSTVPLALTTWASLRAEPLLFCCACDWHIG